MSFGIVQKDRAAKVSFYNENRGVIGLLHWWQLPDGVWFCYDSGGYEWRYNGKIVYLKSAAEALEYLGIVTILDKKNGVPIGGYATSLVAAVDYLLDNDFVIVAGDRDEE